LVFLLVQLLAWRFQRQASPAPPPQLPVPHQIWLFRVPKSCWWKLPSLPAAFRLSDSTQMATVPDVSVPRFRQKPAQEAAIVPDVGLLRFGPRALEQEAGKIPILVLLLIGQSRVLSDRNLPPK